MQWHPILRWRKILKVANSPLYNARRSTAHVRQAINLIPFLDVAHADALVSKAKELIISIGLACRSTSIPFNGVQDLINAADKALCAAKGNGRNQLEEATASP